MKDSLRGRKLDHEYCISRMDILRSVVNKEDILGKEFITNRCGVCRLLWGERLMVTTDRIELAKQLSKHFHRGQKYGEHDYYEYHILGVVKTLELVAKEVTEDMIIVALLHDVLEDTECTCETIENLFGQEISDCVNCLTYVKGYCKEAYVKNTCSYEVTRIVKYADSLFNYQECVKVGDIKRAEKYQRNLQQLYSKELFKC